MTLIRDVLERDPVEWAIPNDGVAKVGPPETPQEWSVLEYELRSFVAEGEYAAGLERILASFLSSMDRPTQPAVWVSGFFGSGKSHLLKALTALWIDIALPDGAKAADLIQLPEHVTDQLTELRTRGQQLGGRFAAAGMLNAGESSAALSILSIVLASAGYPRHYPAARLALWLKGEGKLDAVEAHLRAAGRTLAGELLNMYVSQRLADAIVTNLPGYFANPTETLAAIRAQFPPVESISEAEFIEVLDQTLRTVGRDGEIPLTLVVLDELQQFLADDQERILEVQGLVEASCSKFGSRLLLAGAGQMALAATPTLQKLHDRFRIAVSLHDTDVDRVVRSVVLRKKPGTGKAIDDVLDRAAGEVSRQLAGSAIAHTAADAQHLVADYPLLPTRRRFWDAALRAMDTAGRGTKLRSQLRVVLDATRDIARSELGAAIPGDALYDHKRDEYLGAGTLPGETAQIIAELDDGSPAGRLQSRIAKLAYLIGKLPKEGPRQTGVQSSAESITDLLVTDLRTDRGAFAATVPEALDALLKRHVLHRVQDEFLLQTPTATEWGAEFEMHRRDLESDELWLATERVTTLQAALEIELKKLRVTQGDASVSRHFRAFLGEDDPKAQDDEVPIWVRDGWDATERVVKERARAAGVSSPTVFVFIPKDRAAELRNALIEREAARRTIERRAPPTTQEGTDARAGIDSQRVTAKARSEGIVDDLLRRAKVFQGGGAEISEPSANPTLTGSITRAVENAVLRLYPDFHVADSNAWGRVIDLAKQGNPAPLASLDHKGEVEDHPVVKLVLASLGPTGRKGQELRRAFLAPPYGWPQDAIDGALLALLATGKVEARHNGISVGPKAIPQNILGNVEFRPQTVVIGVQQRVAVRALAQKVGIQVQGKDDVDLPGLVLSRMIQLAGGAGGDAPLPPKPSVERLRDLESMAGNTQFAALADAAAELEELAVGWQVAADRVAAREREWAQAQRLLRHADGIAAHEAAAVRFQAIAQDRSLLSDPDPLNTTIAELSDALREQVNARWSEYQTAREMALTALDRSPDWIALTASDRSQILSEEGLDSGDAPRVGTVDELLATLDDLPLRDWRFRIQAVNAQVGKALARAAASPASESVALAHEPAVIHDADELEAYLNKTRKLVEPHLADGKTVII